MACHQTKQHGYTVKKATVIDAANANLNVSDYEVQQNNPIPSRPGHYANLNIQCDPGVFKTVVQPHLFDLKEGQKTQISDDVIMVCKEQ